MKVTNKFNIIIICIYASVLIIVGVYALYVRNNDNNVFVNNAGSNGNSSKNNTAISNNTITKPVEKKYDYFVINDFCLQKENNKYSTCNLEDVDSKKFIVYSDNILMGKYYIKRATVWNIFDDNGNYISHSGKITALSESLNIKPISFQEKEFNIENMRIPLTYKNNRIGNNKNHEHYYSIDKYGYVSILYYTIDNENYKLILYTDSNDRTYTILNENVNEDENKTSYILYNAFEIDGKLSFALYGFSELTYDAFISLYELSNNRFSKII